MHRKLGHTRAIKSVERTALPKEQRKQLLFEVEMLKQMVRASQDHPNILKIYEVIKDDRYYHLVTEMLTGGELFDRISTGIRYSERTIAEYLRQILSAVSYCHGKGIIHRDLKPENLIFEDQSEGAQLKVIDFGASCTYQEVTGGLVGTAYYIAPEVIKSKSYDEKCDIWSCGVILYMLLCDCYLGGFPPFNGDTEGKIHKRISKKEVQFPEEGWAQVSRDAINLTRLMLTKDPNRRPAAWELLAHPWLSHADTSDFPESSRLLNLSILTRLKEFRAGSKMRQAALHLITSQFTESRKFKEMRDVFMSLDRDHDGRLSREELMAGYKQLGLGSYEEVDKIMAQWDTSGHGYLAFSEFLTATMSWEHLETQTLEAAFSAFDKDRDGVISAKELKYLLEDVDDGMDELVWDEMLREGDADKDGQVRNRQIDMGDFRKMIVKRVATKVKLAESSL